MPGVNQKHGFTYFVLFCIFKLDVTQCHEACQLCVSDRNAFSQDKTPEYAPFFKVLTYVDF